MWNNSKFTIMEEEKFIAEVLARALSPEGEALAEAAIARQNEKIANGEFVELKEQDIMKVLKVSYIAERFFGKSRSWITHKLNHDIKKNGKPDDFTPEERQKLKEALETIALEIMSLVDDI